MAPDPSPTPPVLEEAFRRKGLPKSVEDSNGHEAQADKDEQEEKDGESAVDKNDAVEEEANGDEEEANGDEEVVGAEGGQGALAVAAPRARKAAAKSTASPSRSYARWTDDETKRLIKLHVQGKSFLGISRILADKTVDACSGRWFRVMQTDEWKAYRQKVLSENEE